MEEAEVTLSKPLAPLAGVNFSEVLATCRGFTKAFRWAEKLEEAVVVLVNYDQVLQELERRKVNLGEEIDSFQRTLSDVRRDCEEAQSLLMRVRADADSEMTKAEELIEGLRKDQDVLRSAILEMREAHQAELNTMNEDRQLKIQEAQEDLNRIVSERQKQLKKIHEEHEEKLQSIKVKVRDEEEKLLTVKQEIKETRERFAGQLAE